MAKKSMPISNDFCPQTLFLYGTYKEDGTPNFGLFCWISYYWDSQLGIMACIEGKKLTKDRIHANGIFSANLVTQALLPLADKLGNTEGYSNQKSSIPLTTEKGQVLDVPILSQSPVAFELEVAQSIQLDSGEIFLCKIRNVLVDETLTQGEDIETLMRRIAPVCTTCSTYFSWNGESLGAWGFPQEKWTAEI